LSLPFCKLAMENSKITEYYELPGFDMIYLEDSYVLGLTVHLDHIEIQLDAVLREGHPDYLPPVAGEQYCYRKARILFTGFTNVTLSNINRNATIDIDGEADYGNIDQFRRLENEFLLSGAWGDFEIVGGKVEIALGPEFRDL